MHAFTFTRQQRALMIAFIEADAARARPTFSEERREKTLNIIENGLDLDESTRGWLSVIFDDAMKELRSKLKVRSGECE